MKFLPLATRLLRNNLIHLTFISCGVCLGVIFALIDGWSLRWLACAALWQIAFVLWGIAQFHRGSSKVRRLRAIASVQLHALMEIIANVLASAAAVAPLILLFVLTDTGFGAAVSAQLQRADFSYISALIVQASIVLAIAIAWARLHKLVSERVDLSTLCDGDFYCRRMEFPADATSAEKALERALERMRAPTIPHVMRYQMAAPASVTRSDGNFTVCWAYRPCQATISLSPADGARCRVQVNFEHRTGFVWEPILNIIDVHLFWNFLNMHVMQPLTAELSLSQAVNKHDELRQLARESQLRILQAQIEPHFLFNTLANVRHLYRSSHEAGEQMMDHLITYLRGTLDELRSDASTLGKEMDLALHYLAIMKIRMGKRLSYSFILPPKLAEHPFAPAMLISLVENAIKHGLHDHPDGKLLIEARQEGQMLLLTVQDNGAGLSSISGTGVGLSNIRQRLEAIHGTRAWLEVGALHSGGFMARIAIPIHTGAPV